MRGIREDAAPWSFFLPVTLAVIVGILVAELGKRGLESVLEPDELVVIDSTGAQPKAAEARMPVAAPAPTPTAGPAGDDAVPSSTPIEEVAASLAVAPQEGRDADAVPAPPDMPSAAGEPSLPELPGPIVAVRDGAPAACINGTIALRDENGWQQRLENDAPVACVEKPAAAAR